MLCKSSFSSTLVLTEPITISEHGHLHVHNRDILIESAVSGNGKMTFLDHLSSPSDNDLNTLLLRDSDLHPSDSEFLITGDCSNFTGDLNVEFGKVKFTQNLPQLRSLSLSYGFLSVNSLGFSDTDDAVLHIRLSQKFLPLQVNEKLDLSQIKKIELLNLGLFITDRGYQFFSAHEIIPPLLGWKAVLSHSIHGMHYKIYERNGIFYLKIVSNPLSLFFLPEVFLLENPKYLLSFPVLFSFVDATYALSGQLNFAQVFYIFAEEIFDKNEIKTIKIQKQYEKFKKRLQKKEYQKIFILKKTKKNNKTIFFLKKRRRQKNTFIKGLGYTRIIAYKKLPKKKKRKSLRKKWC